MEGHGKKALVSAAAQTSIILVVCCMCAHFVFAGTLSRMEFVCMTRWLAALRASASQQFGGGLARSWALLNRIKLNSYIGIAN